ncbi:MAG: hypothetical protein RLP44_15795 [Aggregatilineales bacterium]
MERIAHTFRQVAERVSIAPVKDLIKQPGMRNVHRVTVHYHDFRASDAVATLTQRLSEPARLEVIYEGHFDHKPLTRQFSATDFERFCQVFLNIRFDKMIDQQGVSPFGVDVCMVERASGGFERSIIFAPSKADGYYATVYNAVSAYIPEVVREVKS